MERSTEPSTTLIAAAALFALSLPTTPRGFRTYISTGLGLWLRGRRQTLAWQPHIASTRRFIAEATFGASGGTLAVLGSGPLFDIPLDLLAARFGRVVLIDRTHLFPAQRRARRHHNVELVWRDLAGSLDFLNELPGLSQVLSTNLLSQLAYGASPGDEYRVIEHHLATLARLDCRVTLITDFACETRDRGNRLQEHFDLLYGFGLPAPDAGWRWEVAPFGEESASYRRTHEVAAFIDWRQAARGAGFSAAPSFAIASVVDPVAQQDRAQDS